MVGGDRIIPQPSKKIALEEITFILYTQISYDEKIKFKSSNLLMIRICQKMSNF